MVFLPAKDRSVNKVYTESFVDIIIIDFYTTVMSSSPTQDLGDLVLDEKFF